MAEPLQNSENPRKSVSKKCAGASLTAFGYRFKDLANPGRIRVYLQSGLNFLERLILASLFRKKSTQIAVQYGTIR
jgi:hypothetical protein